MRPSGPASAAGRTSLLAAARAAALRGFPSVPRGSATSAGSSAALSLTKPQQQGLRGFLAAIESTARDAARLPPAQVLQSLVATVGLAEHVEKMGRVRSAHRRAFTVHVPGQEPPRAESSSDDESEDEWGLTPTLSSSEGGTTVALLLRTAHKVDEQLRAGGSSRLPPIEALSRFVDEMAIATHEEYAEASRGTSSSSARGADQLGTVVTTLHQAKVRELDLG